MLTKTASKNGGAPGLPYSTLLSGSATDVSAVQPSQKDSLIARRLATLPTVNLIAVRLVQSRKAEAPTEVMLGGSTTEVMPDFSNADAPTDKSCVLDAMVHVVSREQESSADAPMLVTFVSDSCDRFEQNANAKLPMDTSTVGKDTRESEVHAKKAWSPMLKLAPGISACLESGKPGHSPGTAAGGLINSAVMPDRSTVRKAAQPLKAFAPILLSALAPEKRTVWSVLHA
mmetsp:Transcript_72165/g.120146  ORF Transcript_72165/g.120146 Transcript_72165/m.120146 type:complete len:230 (-) Transcript_72165:270-959(-)